MRDYRRFAPSTAAIAEEWASKPVIDGAWVATGHRWNSFTKPYLVRQGKLQAVKKPGVHLSEFRQVAAREKIASDLAYELRLPVPPAILWNCRCSGDDGTYAVISAWAYERPESWGVAKKILSSPQIEELRAASCAMMPFETWIAARDRHDENVLVNVEPSGRPTSVWIDYALSLDGVWGRTQSPDCPVVERYPLIGKPDLEAIREVARGIATMENSVIEQIVNRIPEECMSKDIASSIASNLLARRSIIGGMW